MPRGEGSRVVKLADRDPELEVEVKRGEGGTMKPGGREHGGGGVWSGNKRGLMMRLMERGGVLGG